MKTVITYTTISDIQISNHNWSSVDPNSDPIPRVLGDWNWNGTDFQYNIYYTTDEGQEGFWQNYGPAVGGFNPVADGVNIIADNIAAPNTNYFIRQSAAFDGTVNVKWFGAIGDDTNDDTDAIQSALEYISRTDDTSPDNEAKYGGGTVILPKGIYKITDTLLVGQNCRLQGVNNRYHFEYLKKPNPPHPSGAGTLIKANFDSDKWVISSATYKYASSPKVLLPFNKILIKSTLIDEYSFNNYLYRMGINIENLTIDGNDTAFGGIRLSNAGNSCVRNVGVHRAKCGIMLNTCWGGSIENCFVNMDWYGALVIDCNSSVILNCYFRGISGESPISEEDLPDFIFHEQPYTDWDLNDDVKFGKVGIYSYKSTSLSVTGTVVEATINGISCLNSTMSLESNYFENLSRYGIVIGIDIRTELIANQIFLYNINAGFYFGKNAIAKLNSVLVVRPYDDPYDCDLYVNDESSYRNINFTNTIYYRRKYFPDIQFTDEGQNGANYGAVYVNPLDGDDENYGFNENDAIQTFDAALIRIRNQSTLNPVRTIYIKGAQPIGEGIEAKDEAAIKNGAEITLQNADVLITSYQTDESHPKGRIYFDNEFDEGDQGIGQVVIEGNTNLYFRNVDLICNTPTNFPPNPPNSTMFGLMDAYARLTFQSDNADTNHKDIYLLCPISWLRQDSIMEVIHYWK